MKSAIFFTLMMLCAVISVSIGQIPANQDTIVIPGDLPRGTILHAGALESTINGDTTGDGERLNTSRVYALQEGHFYYQNSAIRVVDPYGTLTIVGIPDSAGTTKPVILMQPVPGKGPVGSNVVYGSIKMVNVHYQATQLDGTKNGENFYCGTKNKLPESLRIDNCLFEFSNIDLFDCTNESGAIGGWPYGAKFFITNSYFRNMFEPSQWWGSRIFQCKHPIDTLWVENNTIVGGGLTFLQQNELTDVAYFNHNTIINNKKNWLVSPYHRNFFVTNNIFVNQNWVGEDTNMTSSGEDPDRFFMSTIILDTNNASHGLVVQPKYYDGDSAHYSPVLNLSKLQVFVSDNVNYEDPLLSSGYYNTLPGTYDSTSYPLSYLGWFYPGPYRVNNIPCEWMNARTQALFADYAPPTGGFVERRTSTSDPRLATPGIADASVVDLMARWNQHQYGDPRFPVAPDIVHSKFMQGDYDPTTIPGRDSLGNKTENGSGIWSFTELTENYSQNTVMSTIDGFPVGSLIWDDALNAAYAQGHPYEFMYVYMSYIAMGGVVSAGEPPLLAADFALEQNYPNPFNPSTTIEFALPQRAAVLLSVFNVLGQKVATLVNGTLTAGVHAISFDGSGLASGMYFYRISAGKYASVKRMMLLK